ncbi:hypothetical protein GCM10010168_25600 [Actinoplanes ianthinogenes]|uniref:Uncharacterized protein n=1 Tax=Actinoplanes ianthinogenes TaxID=122358 RepID=A0ABM7M9B1_9ACTN|nr:hypothetical protein [Actinoplanes ianthinogenes]BCJ48200.1 hypothetical protein Aiant_88570 [Actinoplanes ianthinogenes]GGR07106.1 hypothetical protein GCM10010168_25600 [Actinoplanes ianthinogenes]
MIMADAGAAYMFVMLGAWLFFMPFVMIGLGLVSGSASSARTRRLGVIVSVLVMTWFVASFAISKWRGFDDEYFWADEVNGSLCALGWLLVPWLVTLLLAGRSRRRAGRPAPVPDDEIPVVPDDELP